MDKRNSYQRQTYFVACLVPLLATDLVQILIIYHYSVDRGMWPIVLLFMFGVSFLYSGLVYLLAHLTRHYIVTVAVFHQSLLGAVLVTHTLAFYLARPDWLAVNNGILRLTPFQAVVYNRWTPWVIYVFFYLVLVLRLAKFRRKG